MSAARPLAHLRASVAARRSAILCALAAAPLCALVALALRQASTRLAWGIGVGGLLLLALLIARARRRIDARWLARALDRADPRMEDSAELLWREADSLSPLAQLQQQRLRQRVDEHLPDLRAAWPVPALLASLAIALTLALLGLWSAPPPASPPAATAPAPVATLAAHLSAQTLTAIPPTYTGAATQTLQDLDARVAVGASLQWRLQFDPAPATVQLRFDDGQVLALQHGAQGWTAQRSLPLSLLYRIEVDAAPLLPDRLYRLDAIDDQPAQIQVTLPDKTLSLRSADQGQWEFAFRGSDDYGLGEASVSITLAQGSGENIQVSERTVRLRGEGSARQRQYRHRIDLNALGMAAGDDLIVRATLQDNRAPQAQRSRSASYILRWPPPRGDDSVGLDGLVQTTLPAYFRSQRQLIIDTEALIKARPTLDEAHFLEQSDRLGVEQKILRLRYGQFLGEEFESAAAEHAAKPTDSAASDAHDEASTAAPPTHAGHDETATPTRFGVAGDVVAEFGHVHDESEAATLLDPQTRQLLKAALDQMWQSELQLRSGQPVLALPFEYKALEHIKQVQQASRIYLARVGLELPPIDESRRLSGERAGLRDASASTVPAAPEDAELDALWSSLREGAAVDFARFDTWLQAQRKRLPDPLGLSASADALRRDPACGPCRDQLLAQLWPLLSARPAATAARTQPDAGGRAYLDALAAPRQP